MNKSSIIIIVFLILVGGYFVLNSDDNKSNDNDNAKFSTFIDSETGVQFEFKTDPDGYVIDDLSEFISMQPEGIEVAKVYRIMNAREKIELETSEGGREGPPIITLMIFKDKLSQSANMWVDGYPMYSNIEFALGEVNRDTTVGGASAVRYRSDGLYQSENVAIAHGGYIFYFNGAFLEEDSVIHQDFKKMIDSVTFLPTDSTDAPQAKIHPKVACESALAYMTFPSGAEADEFVANCIAGNHPEVIERYIKDLGLDRTTI
jgi:hypothetical protein